MNKIVMYFFLIFLLAGCKKSDNGDDSWIRIDFKTDYTIQVPKGFVGNGMGGFEGNTFYKASADGNIQLNYGYCGYLFCTDFGDTLNDPVPSTIQMQNNSQTVILDQIEYFRDNSDTTGIFYFSENDAANGRLYWKDNGILKEAMDVKFIAAKLDMVYKIIGTIKRK